MAFPMKGSDAGDNGRVFDVKLVADYVLKLAWKVLACFRAPLT
jgi:hypothetical protein